MGLYEIYSHPVYYRYKSSICSKATLFVLLCLPLTLIPPLLIAYRSQGFWLTTNTYEEQGDVTYKKQIMMVLDLSTQGDYLAWSTYPNYNLLLQNNLRIPSISSSEIDTNNDGRKDQLSLNISVPLTSTESVISASLIIIFDYKLYRMSTFDMESLAYVNYASGTYGAALTISGDLRLYQKSPLFHRGTDVRFNTSIVDSTSQSASDYDISNILQQYSTRNVSTVLQNMYPVWKTNRGSTEPFMIQVTINYPIETIVYVPGFWELVKWGWVQYVTILLLFIWIFREIKEAVFKGQIFNTVVQMPKLYSNKNF